MTSWVYILQSESTGRYYRSSKDNVQGRVGQHNDPDYHGSETKQRFRGSWKLIWKGSQTSRAQAMAREKQIKKRGIWRFLEESVELAESDPGRLEPQRITRGDTLAPARFPLSSERWMRGAQ